MAQRVITTEDVSIKTVSVEIQAIRIGKKEMTLAVFRQLPEKSVIDRKTGLLQGEPWGWVNYCVGCDATSRHLHVVWQDGGQLKRSSVQFSVNKNHRHGELRWDLDRLALAYVATVSLEGHYFVDDKGEMAKGKNLRLDVKGRTLFVEIIPLIRDIWDYPQHLKEVQGKLDAIQAKSEQDFTNETFYNTKEYTVERAKKDLERYIESGENHRRELEKKVDEELSGVTVIEIPEGFSSKIIYDAMEAVAEELNAFERAWQQSYNQLEALDQLFIAV